VNVFPSGSLIGILQVKLKGLLREPLKGDGVPKTGGRLAFVVKVYHFLVTLPLPPGSVAFTQTVYEVEYARPDNARDFVPLVALFPLLTCPLLQ
jgi:hypothetical protein